MKSRCWKLSHDSEHDSVEQEDLLAVARAAYEESDSGEPLSSTASDIAYGIWMKGQNPKALHKLGSKHLCPCNTGIHKVDLNQEIQSMMPGYTKARDLRMQVIQANIAKASIPAFRLVDAPHSKNSTISRQVYLVNDTCSILARSANVSINQLFWELVQPSLQKHQVLCNKPPAGQIRHLFGDELHEQVKAANTTSSLWTSQSAIRGRGSMSQMRYHPYHPTATLRTRPTDNLAATHSPLGSKTGSSGPAGTITNFGNKHRTFGYVNQRKFVQIGQNH